MGFAKDQLERLTKSALFNLADYYELEYSSSILKDDLVELIYNHANAPVSDEDSVDNLYEEYNDPPASVRIRRIRKARAEGKEI